MVLVLIVILGLTLVLNLTLTLVLYSNLVLLYIDFNFWMNDIMVWMFFILYTLVFEIIITKSLDFFKLRFYKGRSLDNRPLIDTWHIIEIRIFFTRKTYCYKLNKFIEYWWSESYTFQEYHENKGTIIGFSGVPITILSTLK